MQHKIDEPGKPEIPPPADPPPTEPPREAPPPSGPDVPGEQPPENPVGPSEVPPAVPPELPPMRLAQSSAMPRASSERSNAGAQPRFAWGLAGLGWGAQPIVIASLTAASARSYAKRPMPTT